jgi:plastocyanin
MKNLITLIFILLFSISSKATTHEILVWDGYMRFLPSTLTVQLGDTIQWLPLDHPTMVHSITSTNIPVGASTFDQVWQAPADTFFQYIPQVVGLYEYECTPHAPNMAGSFEVIDSTNNIIENNENLLLVYPNPTKDLVNLEIESYNGSFNVDIYDLQGRLLETTKSRTISLKKYSKGIYVFRVIYGDITEELRILRE